MNNDFDPNNHKNLELFRYYLNRDLARIDHNIQSNHNELYGYFIASLVDMSIVVFFNDFFAHKSICIKLTSILVLIALFICVSKIANALGRRHNIRQKELGKEEYLLDDARQAIIDSFDNIACDSLLICENYLQRHQTAEEEYVKNFYLYEIIHHLTKSVDVFNEIISHPDLYISSKDSELIDSYRINNYIDYAKAIYKFLCDAIQKPITDLELKKDLENLNASVSSWKYV